MKMRLAVDPDMAFAGPIVASTLLILCASSLPAADWYRWRGPDLNGISRETGWSTAWPKEGPRTLWKANVGTGFSSMSVAQGRVFTLGNRNNEETVYCFDAAKGNVLWSHHYAEKLNPKFYEGGPSSTPTVDLDRVYTLSRGGRLICFEAATGKIVWQKNITQDLGLDTAKEDYWGFAGSPLVEGDLLILNAGTAGTALEKATGKVAWNNGKEACGYATPVPFDDHGQRGVAIFAAQALVAVEPRTGRELWQFPWKTKYDVNAADPIFSSGSVFVSSGYRSGGALMRRDGDTFTTVWKNQNMHNQLSPSVLIDGYLYGCSGQNGYDTDLRCVDWQTGEVKWREPSAGLGALMAADGKLIVLGEKGELIIAEATPAAFKPLARAQVTGGKCWTVPVLSNGRIYCRNAKGDVVCLDVRGR